MHKRIISLLLSILIISALCFFFFYHDGGWKKNDTASYKTIEVTRGTISKSVTGRGRLHCKRMEYIHTRRPGRIASFLIKEGDSVRQYQRLIKITPEPHFVMEVKKAIMALDRTKLELTRIDKDLSKQQKLLKEGFATRATVEQLEKTKVNLSGEVAIAEQTIKIFEKDIGQTGIDKWDWRNFNSFDIFLLSPFEGTVLDVKKIKGEFIHPGGPPNESVLTIGDLDEYLVCFHANEIDLGMLQLSQRSEVIFDIFPNRPLPGVVEKISRIAAHIDPRGNEQASRFKVDIALSDIGPNIRIGMSCHIKIIVSEKKEALIVPIESLLKADGKFIALRTNGNDSNTLEKIKVQTGLVDGHSIEITTGINEGDRIVRWPASALAGKADR